MNEEKKNAFLYMFIPKASLRLYTLPQKKINKKIKNDEEKGMVTLCVHFALALFMDCALYLKTRQELLCTLRQV